MGARFVIQRRVDETGGHWAYIDSCPHGLDLGAIHVGPSTADLRTAEEAAARKGWEKLTWAFADLGGGRCSISPSILAIGVHNGQDCHFGPGQFPFIWLEEGELRNTDPFYSRYRAWVAGEA